MVFSSHIFLFYFLPVALLLYYGLPNRWRNLVLTLVSYVFYGWANPLFVGLLLLSTLVDYASGLLVAAPQSFSPGGMLDPLPKGVPRSRLQKTALVVSLSSNLLLLGFFKYFNFTIDSFNAIAAAFGVGGAGFDVVLRVTLPLGISFYTFQSMSYIIDVYRGDARAIRNFVDYACFVAMFPQLVAGPIIRFSEVAEQLRKRVSTMEKFARGVAFFALGFAKKIILANPCGKIADTVFGGGPGGCLESWYGVVAYAFQIYFDFSAYSDMAIGLGLMLGFVFPKNFDAPYRACSITEFWRRWHISLSSWLKDYLYVPLGGNRAGPWRTYRNILLVMLIGGLWHGAAWKFVVWGGLHGVLLAIERLRGKASFYDRLPRPLQMSLTFVIVLFTWVFFRSADLSSAIAYCGRMLGLGTTQESAVLLHGVLFEPYYLVTFALCAVVVWGMPQTWDWTRRLNPAKVTAAFALLLVSVLLLNMQSYNPFIYFIF